MQKFDQTEFFDVGLFGYSGLAKYGFVYYPNQCVDGTTKCKIVVSLHGGNQEYENSGFRWIKTDGFGGYAASNDLIVLFPQVGSKANKNPRGCWDFGGWGTVSDKDNLYATNLGV